jgi:hypothetical protein
MTRFDTPFATDGELIIIKGIIAGPLGTTTGRFVVLVEALER